MHRPVAIFIFACRSMRVLKGFFNTVTVTQYFAQSRNPNGYFWHPTSRAYPQSQISPWFCFKILTLELKIRGIPDPGYLCLSAKGLAFKSQGGWLIHPATCTIAWTPPTLTKIKRKTKPKEFFHSPAAIYILMTALPPGNLNKDKYVSDMILFMLRDG